MIRFKFRLQVIGIMAFAATTAAIACTSAIVGRASARHGRMLMWKHRDSGAQHSFIARVEPTDTSMAYVALFNAGDSLRREAWIGYNSAGFAVMNTASYNLAPDTAQVRDREGLIMSEALRRCHTLADFTALLDSALRHSPIGVQANFGVVDAAGGGAYVECNDHGYKVFPLSDEPAGFMVRTNFSYSGGSEKRLGAVRYRDAMHLLADPAARADISAELFTDTLSRSFYNDEARRDYADGKTRYTPDKGEMIPRRTSTASVVIEGPLPGEDPAATMIMWVAPGFPPASHVQAVRLDSVPQSVSAQGVAGESPMSREAFQHRQRTFPRKNKHGQWLLDLQYILPLSEAQRQRSLAEYERERSHRAASPTPE